ncbi:outer membrane protein assembly factor BamB family protein [Halomarina litorea]|uniref:outer membrane protein assembly factor BamB family protein n=1 Tax=Halomarina litorea TaxID=2961595 RepID=UPI0020C37CDE|nr:PQQ-binding-like beta-propeller repeat protein [Halomarina sp. BCD28]
MRRRRALHLASGLLAGSLAGCTALGDALTGPRRYERDAPVDSRSVGPWPTLGHDARRSGYAPDVSGPPADASVSSVVDAGLYPEMQPVLAADTLYYGANRRDADGSSSRGPFSGFVATGFDGTERWTVAESKGLATPTVVGDAVFTTSAGNTRALDRRDGSLCWQYDVGYGSPGASPTVLDGTVYVTDGEVTALDARTGERRWVAEVNTASPQGTAATPDLVAATSGSGGEGGAYGIDPADGTLLWNAGAVGESYAPPVIGDGRVFVVTTDGTLHALDSADGSPVWRHELRRSAYERVTVAEEMVYVKGTNDRTLFALDTVDGTERWSVEFDAGAPRLVPTVAADRVYVAEGVDHGAVSVLDAATGDRLNRYDLPSAPTTGPVVGDGFAVVGTGRHSSEGRLVVLS